ncbi:MAG: hypothetical protein R6X34_16155, partial [Chloroflexota bacterium]
MSANTPTKKSVFFIWLGWVVIMVAYYIFVPARFSVRLPDNVLSWTADSTRADGYQSKKYYLQDPALSRYVA